MTIDAQLQALADRAATAVALTGIPAVATWTAYVDDVRAVVNRIRALEVADLVYLNGLTLQDIAETASATLTRQAVGEWLERHGPKQYAVVQKAGVPAAAPGRQQPGGVSTVIGARRSAASYTITWVPVLGTVQTRRELAGLRANGARVAPARWQIDEAAPGSARDLWHRIGA